MQTNIHNSWRVTRITVIISYTVYTLDVGEHGLRCLHSQIYIPGK